MRRKKPGSESKIRCQICGGRFRVLGGAHLMRRHGMTAAQYRKKYGVRHTAVKEYREAVRARNDTFTAQQLRWLRDHAHKHTVNEIAQRWGMPPSRVRNRLQLEKLVPKAGTRGWSEDEVKRAVRRRRREGHEMHYSAVRADDMALEQAARRYFGSWGNALTAAGLDADRIQRRTKWTTETIRTEIRRRHRQRKGLSYNQVRREHRGLLTAARDQFGTWAAAVEAAGVDYSRQRIAPPPMSASELKQRIRSRADSGESMATTVVAEQDGHLYATAVHRHGSWRDAVASALGKRKARLLMPSARW